MTPGNFIDLTSKRFGRLTVQSRGAYRGGKVAWLCNCDCGNTKLIAGNNLRSGMTKSCGCVSREKARARHLTHGASRTKLYSLWNAMRRRCNDPKSNSYKYYGARGIKVDPRWDDFSVFASDMGERPEGHSLDRKDVDGPYSPENCIWSTYKDQVNNRRPFGSAAVRIAELEAELQKLKGTALIVP